MLFYLSDMDCLQVVEVRLKKTGGGFGFTIVGGEAPRELKQIKSIVPGSVAAMSGRLQVADVLVRINDICVLLFTHDDVSVVESRQSYTNTVLL